MSINGVLSSLDCRVVGATLIFVMARVERFMWLYVWLVFVFGLGACVGSFLNVAVARMPANISVFWPPSRCGKCLAPVRWYDNLPLVSYWWLGGRCRRCGDATS